jgi:site-specific DNA-methyltransferase (adenine-specific)
VTSSAPYYETPADAPCKVRLYLGDCREILPLVAPPGPRVLLLADPPYGVSERTKRRTAGRGKPIGSAGSSFRSKNPKLIQSKDWSEIVGDDAAFRPAHLLTYPRTLLWGANHFADVLPASNSWIVWDKRDHTAPDDNGDAEVAWTRLGGPIRLFAHAWRGVCRASERGEPHLHPTQKPVAFYRWLFAGRGRGKPVVKAGDLIVSPYLGSGPEIRVAIEFGLDAIGIDVERKYLDVVIKHRIEPALKAARQGELPGLSRRLQPRSRRPREEQIAMVIP